ncbi:DUF4397 domain-containing protein [Bacillus tianshenii]|nr:DUF4397 domain-containing protein [Bacillus tianshenii]
MKKFAYICSSMLVLLLAFTLPTNAFAKETVKESMVRIIHASPDAPAVDIYVDGKLVAEKAAFKDVTDYLKLPAGKYKVEVFASGTKDEQDPVIQADLTTEAGQAYTAAAVNTVDKIELVVTKDDLTLPKGTTKIRVGHFSPNAPEVTVKLKDGKPVFENVAFKDVTSFTQLSPGIYDFVVNTAVGNQQVLDLSGTKLEADTIYSVYAVNTADKIEPLIVTYSLDMQTIAMNGGADALPERPSSTPYIAASALIAGLVLFVGMNKALRNR